MSVKKRLALGAVMGATILLAACSSTPVAPPMAAKVATPATTLPAAANKPTVPVAVAATPLSPYLDPLNPLYKERSVYFDFDQAAVKPNAAPLMELHGRFLATHPAVSIKIQGNTDELGGTEYNLALGQKRAEAVLKTLKIYGVKDSQMEAVSFGEEKPKAMGHEETAYAQNRRADLAYPVK
ncbi:peptidoglycan-associated lipoprotein Pal [Rhodoferax sp. UBA5149]|uniref:peptidoglycan-associated lipoprotein Pal n=1 Tax=Rhodoferax sp. UBA5149 TaxID=1947379 RepID=UPI0025DCC6E5|nr:peptidoglycan-associated lipoprotein Pal [Rhodoferax sp. UBA5149]